MATIALKRRAFAPTLTLLTLSTLATACGGAAGERSSMYFAGPAGRAVGAYPASPPPVQAPAPAGGPAPAEAVAQPERTPERESFRDYGVNPFVETARDRLSTFAVDVDTASYAFSRRRLREGALPDPAAVRTEEFLNAFDYGYAPPAGDAPFAVHADVAPSPFEAGKHLLRVALQGKRVAPDKRAPAHLVYLVDTSGSMQGQDRLGLAQKSLRALTRSLKPGDTVALCTYAGSVREVLPPTGVERRDRILAAIDELSAGGSTAMGDGILTAYRLAERTLAPGHVSRVIVLSDGDANVGATSHEAILARIKQYRQKGITLSTVGFGTGNYRDTMMEQLADKGDGNYTYIDDEAQAEKVFAKNLDGMLEVIARDVKVQVEFDPAAVTAYRLVGYENRDVADRDFRDDRVDGGEVGAGHSVTALYELVLARPGAKVGVVRLRHKAPFGDAPARETAVEVGPGAWHPTFDAAPASMRWATAVAGFAEAMRGGPSARTRPLAEIDRIGRAATDDRRERHELLELVGRARQLGPQARVGEVAR